MTCALVAAAIAGCGGGSKESKPTVTAVAPTTMCADGGTLTVTGTDFQDGAVVSINSTDLTTTFGGATSLTATVPSGTAAGTYDVTVTNPDGGTATLTGGLTVVDDPLVFFVDPGTDYNALAIDITIYVSGINGTVAKVEYAPHGQTTRTTLTGFTQDAAHPNRIHATLPSGLAAGAYDVFVTDSDGCEGSLANAFTVTDTATLTLTSIDPAFGWTGADTAVTIHATGDALLQTPHVYLNPQTGSGTAAAARAVAWVDANTLTAIVPQGLTAGVYDVIVINPDGTVGALTGSSGFTVTSDPPPDITDITPASIDSSSTATTTVTVTGTGFNSAAQVTLSCVDSTGAALPDQTITPSSVAADGTSLAFGAPPMAAGDVCVITITNPDTLFDKFSALVVTTPSSNLEVFQDSTTAPDAVKDMNTARRAPIVISGHVTKQQRYLYAIGGDDGTDAGALDTVEGTPIDLFGRMVGWTAQAQGTQARNLDSKRTLAQGARIGSYIYVAGGFDGTAVLGTISRARILDPLQAPTFDDLDFATDATPGLGAGGWVYEIAAVMPQDGEGLPSDPINVTVPDLSAIGKTLSVTVSWTAVPGATGYKVYRTLAANDSASNVVFLANATSTSYTDDGSQTPAADALPPLTIGSLGSWYSVGTLTTPREGAAVTAAHGATSNDWFLYVGGGDDGTQVLASYEVMPVTIATDGSQTAGTVAVGDKSIGSARARLSAWTADDSVTTLANGNSWVYFGSGESHAGGTVFATTVGEVNTTTGMLTSTAATALDALTPHSTKSGTGKVAANGFLYDFGGGPTPSAGGESAEICTSGVPGCTGSDTIPKLGNWNSLGGGGVLIPRYLNAAAIESAFIYVAGGYGGLLVTPAALTSVERTIL